MARMNSKYFADVIAKFLAEKRKEDIIVNEDFKARLRSQILEKAGGVVVEKRNVSDFKGKRTSFEFLHLFKYLFALVPSALGVFLIATYFLSLPVYVGSEVAVESGKTNVVQDTGKVRIESVDVKKGEVLNTVDEKVDNDSKIFSGEDILKRLKASGKIGGENVEFDSGHVDVSSGQNVVVVNNQNLDEQKNGSSVDTGDNRGDGMGSEVGVGSQNLGGQQSGSTVVDVNNSEVEISNVDDKNSLNINVDNGGNSAVSVVKNNDVNNSLLDNVVVNSLDDVDEKLVEQNTDSSVVPKSNDVSALKSIDSNFVETGKVDDQKTDSVKSVDAKNVNNNDDVVVKSVDIHVDIDDSFVSQQDNVVVENNVVNDVIVSSDEKVNVQVSFLSVNLIDEQKVIFNDDVVDVLVGERTDVNLIVVKDGPKHTFEVLVNLLDGVVEKHYYSFVDGRFIEVVLERVENSYFTPFSYSTGIDYSVVK